MAIHECFYRDSTRQTFRKRSFTPPKTRRKAHRAPYLRSVDSFCDFARTIHACSGQPIRRPANFTTPAKPDETIQLYGTGFGPTSPLIANGIQTDKIYNLSPIPMATLNNQPATVTFAGLIPPLSQIYQVNVTIPPGTPDGDWPLVVTVGGIPSASGLITVQQ